MQLAGTSDRLTHQRGACCQLLSVAGSGCCCNCLAAFALVAAVLRSLGQYVWAGLLHEFPAVDFPAAAAG